ncbi:unnamed protein product [Parajaminaea phylloscopi]
MVASDTAATASLLPNSTIYPASCLAAIPLLPPLSSPVSRTIEQLCTPYCESLFGAPSSPLLVLPAPLPCVNLCSILNGSTSALVSLSLTNPLATPYRQAHATYTNSSAFLTHTIPTRSAMSLYLAPAKRALVGSAIQSSAHSTASTFASTSAFTLTGWVRPVSSSSTSSAQPTSASLSSAAAPLRPTTHFRVTLRRSAIGLPARAGKILSAMGLQKRLQAVYLPQDGAIAGKILAVKELVHVDNVRRLDPPVGRLLEGADGQLAADELTAWHAAIPDEDAVWIDAKGDVIDWGREAKRAPRGYEVVGNLISERRDEAIRTQRRHASLLSSSPAQLQL